MRRTFFILLSEATCYARPTRSTCAYGVGRDRPIKKAYVSYRGFNLRDYVKAQHTEAAPDTDEKGRK